MSVAAGATAVNRVKRKFQNTLAAYAMNIRMYTTFFAWVLSSYMV